MRYVLSAHAAEAIAERRIPLALVESVLQHPQQVTPERGGKNAYQSQIDSGRGRIFLLRAIIDDSVDPAVVVTVYRTRKIGKYWRTA